MVCTMRQLRPRFELRLNTGGHSERTAQVERIGRGRFTTAYREVHTDTVYLIVDEEGDSSKRILMDCDGPYFPKLTLLGDYKNQTVFETHYYPRLTAESRVAWTQFKLMAKCRELAWSGIAYKDKRVPITELGYDINSRTADLVRETNEELGDTLDDLASAACNYGHGYVFEFAPRNLATDSTGHLILLDPVFDLRELERQRKEAESKRSQR